MLRILAFLLVVLAAGLGFAWLADRPGEVAISWLGQEVQLSFLTFLVAAVLLFTAIFVVVWLLGGLFAAPARIGGYFSGRRRERGYRALTDGILAAGAGDATTARRMVQKSQKYLAARNEPLLRFLDAQTAMIEGDHARARRAFEAMEREPETRLLALRGLYLEAERVNDPVAARHYAEQAVRIAPHVPWAGGAVLELKAAEGDFDAALDILKAQRNSHLVDRAESHRLRAVLLTGKAQAMVASDPAGAKAAAREAQKLAPELTPAALAAARSMIQLGDFRRAGKVLEKAWTSAPHAEIAELYVHVRPGEGAAERLARAQKLKSIHPEDAESNLAVAHAALDARDLPLARAEAEEAARKAPREAVFLLLADIEDAESGDPRRVRAYMARAIQAPRDPAWMADGVAAAQWSAVSPVTGRLDAYQWQAPTERPAPSRLIGETQAPTEDAGREDEAPGERSTALTLEPASGTVNGSGAHSETEDAQPVPAPGESDAARKDARFNI